MPQKAFASHGKVTGPNVQYNLLISTSNSSPQSSQMHSECEMERNHYEMKCKNKFSGVAVKWKSTFLKDNTTFEFARDVSVLQYLSSILRTQLLISVRYFHVLVKHIGNYSFFLPFIFQGLK